MISIDNYIVKTNIQEAKEIEKEIVSITTFAILMEYRIRVAKTNYPNSLSIDFIKNEKIRFNYSINSYHLEDEIHCIALETYTQHFINVIGSDYVLCKVEKNDDLMLPFVIIKNLLSISEEEIVYP